MKVIVIKKKMNIEPNHEIQEEEIKNTCPEAVTTAIDSINNMRHDSDGNITEESIYRSCQFNKAKAIRTLIMDMMALHPIITADENNIPDDTYDAYVEAGNKIDKYFDNLMEEYIDRNESDECECMCQPEDCPDSDDCDGCNGKAPCGVCNNLTHNCNDCDEKALCGKCSLECDIECGECEHCKECNDEAFGDDSEEEVIYDEECSESELMMDFFTLLKLLKPGLDVIDEFDENQQFHLIGIGKEGNMIKNILNKYEIEEVEE